MRPRAFYVCFANGSVVGITHGAMAARALLGGHRAYKSFKSQLDAEEFAMWWDYDAPNRIRILSPSTGQSSLTPHHRPSGGYLSASPYTSPSGFLVSAPFPVTSRGSGRF